MTRKGKLELTWVGKDERPRLEPRVLIEDPSLSHRAEAGVGGDSPIYDNRLIFGDNLLALKALEQEFAGKVKCIFIDPPYNTGSAFAQYDDGVEHSLWLSLIRDRLELLRILLSEEGSIWIALDDNEHSYCRVLCDEIFGRTNFLANAIWEKADSPRMDAEFFSNRHDNVLVYAKDRSRTVLNRMNVSDSNGVADHYKKVADDGRRYYLKPLRAMSSRDDTREARPSMYFALIAPDGTTVFPTRPDGSEGRWRWGRDKFESDGARVEWVRGRGGWTPYYRIYADAVTSPPPETIWTHPDVGSNRTAMAEQRALMGGAGVFATPKPERLLKRVLELATDKEDIVLDSFAGSGTTGAVAHKMGRRWIMIELGEHAHTHVIPRIRKVIDGEDAGGITEAVNWQGGGGFRYFRLAPSLLEKDSWGNWVINPTYNSAMLAEAVCKLEGFSYAPSTETFWQHGQSTERDFIYVTTQTLTQDQLAELSSQVGPERSLLICCGSFKRSLQFPNLTVKKIPAAVLDKCEFGRDDYALESRRNGEDTPTGDADPAAEAEVIEEPTTA